eukprot:7741848-Pyramimonas_sp.AAC.1
MRHGARPTARAVAVMVAVARVRRPRETRASGRRTRPAGNTTSGPAMRRAIGDATLPCSGNRVPGSAATPPTTRRRPAPCAASSAAML